MVASPYQGKSTNKWFRITKKLISKHPLPPDYLIKVTLKAWEDIFKSDIGSKKFKIGRDILPKPQIMGFLLHELIPLRVMIDYPKLWKKEEEASDKDLVYLPDVTYSTEIKTSSDKRNIFGNRSYGKSSKNSKKEKSGYYLAVNFEKFGESKTPKIRLIRFGWIDHSDWISQKAESGQQASLGDNANRYKLIEIYPNSKLG